VRRLTRERHQVPLDANCSADRAGDATAVEQYGPLFDVELQIGDGTG
jgi:hypothetical protein